MSDEFPRYGQADIGGAFYLIRTVPSMAGTHASPEVAATVHIDGLGHAEHVADAGAGWTPESIAELPTLAQAQARHMAPAFAEAEANQRKWLEEQEREGLAEFQPPPPQMDPATARLYDDSEDD